MPSSQSESSTGEKSVWQAARRLLWVAVIVGVLWIVEALVTSGPIAAKMPDVMPSIISAVLFVICFAAGALAIATRGTKSLTSLSLPDGRWITRLMLTAAIGVSAVAAVTDSSSYNPVLGDESRNSSLLGFIWAPISLASVAAVLVISTRLSKIDWLLVLGVAAMATLVGGRTVPTVIVLMIALRALYLPEHRGTLRRVSPHTLLLLAGVSVLAAVLLSAIAATRSESTGFTEANLDYYGYDFGPPALRNLLATLGIIGESARVTHLAVPTTVPYAGFGLLIDDVLSFLPWASDTVTARTIDIYGAIGSVVFTSRPGGTASTMFILLGDIGVMIGAFAYGLVLMWTLRRAAIPGHRYSAAFFLLLMATFVIGVYGTGTPTSLTLISVLLAWLIVRLSSKSRGRTPQARAAATSRQQARTRSLLTSQTEVSPMDGRRTSAKPHSASN